MEIWQKQIFDKDFTIESGQDLRIEPVGNRSDTMSGGRLVFRNGSITSTAAGNIEKEGKILCLDSEKDILSRTEKFEENYKGSKERGKDSNFFLNYGYSYNYKTGKMVYEEAWINYVDEDGYFNFMAYDHAYSEDL